MFKLRSMLCKACCRKIVGTLMFESLGLDSLTPLGASLIFGVLVGVLFGIFAQLSRFCLRRAVAGPTDERRSALAIWLTALVTALIGTQIAVQLGVIDFSTHRFYNVDMPIVAILVGGILFGIGMVLTRGCISRMTVLSGSGNLRAVMVLLIFAIVSHAMLKGVLAPLRVWLGQFTVSVGEYVSLSQLPIGRWSIVALFVVLVCLVCCRSKASISSLIFGALIGALVPIAWVGTGWILLDDFEPIAFESMSFTLPVSQTLFWTVASTAITPGFGVGLVLGVVMGSAVTHLLRGQVQWQSFESPKQTGRYFAGASLMGIGGVLAGGCTVGAGLAGVASLSTAAILALVAIVAGSRCANLAPGIARRQTRKKMAPLPESFRVISQ